MKYRIRTYTPKIFIADILSLIGYFLSVLADKLESAADKLASIK